MAAHPHTNATDVDQSVTSKGAIGRMPESFDDDIDLDIDSQDDADSDLEGATRVKAQLVEADDGSMVRVPNPNIYPGHPPYGAPVLGFHPKIAEVFDAFVYLPVTGASAERPSGFLPVIGLVGDDPAKDKDPAWKLYGRIRPDVWKQMAVDIGESLEGPKLPSYMMVNAMRSENLAMFTLAQPQHMFATSAWIATLPMSVMRTPMQTIDEQSAKMLARATRAQAEVASRAPDADKSQQLSFSF